MATRPCRRYSWPSTTASPALDLRLRTTLGTSQGNPEPVGRAGLSASPRGVHDHAADEPAAVPHVGLLPLHRPWPSRAPTTCPSTLRPPTTFFPTSQAPLSGMEGLPGSRILGHKDARPRLSGRPRVHVSNVRLFTFLVSAPYQPFMMGGMPFMHNGMVSGSPDNVLDSRVLLQSRSDGSWSFIDVPSGRQSLDAISDSSNVVSPQIPARPLRLGLVRPLR